MFSPMCFDLHLGGEGGMGERDWGLGGGELYALLAVPSVLNRQVRGVYTHNSQSTARIRTTLSVG